MTLISGEHVYLQIKYANSRIFYQRIFLYSELRAAYQCPYV